ncbi:MAG TPA: diacylglycerol kinase family protein, partial [Nitrososphaeraceae archaeon]|nr:diacylglycerol kinase family protein [Nitrososphaeraceae archaeon]
MRCTDNNNPQETNPGSVNKKRNRTDTLSSAPIQLKHERKKKKHATTALVVNPTSAGGSTGKVWDTQFTEIKKIFDQDPEIVFTEKSGDGTSLTRDLLKRGYKRIVAIGGDGTINEVANGFFMSQENNKEKIRRTNIINPNNFRGRRATKSQDRGKFPPSPVLALINQEAVMGLLPSGTRNVLAKSLDFPEDIIQCCSNFIVGKSKKIDVISATVSPPKGTEDSDRTSNPVTRIFLNAAELGVAAEIIDRSKKVRNKVKNRLVSTVTSLAVTLPYYESNLCEISVDNGRENIITKMTMCIIANGKYLGGGFK